MRRWVCLVQDPEKPKEAELSNRLTATSHGFMQKIEKQTHRARKPRVPAKTEGHFGGLTTFWARKWGPTCNPQSSSFLWAGCFLAKLCLQKHCPGRLWGSVYVWQLRCLLLHLHALLKSFLACLLLTAARSEWKHHCCYTRLEDAPNRFPKVQVCGWLI